MTSVSDTQYGKTALKCAVIGDPCAGKTAFIKVFNNEGFSHNWPPTVFESFPTTLNINNEDIHVNICDTSGNEDFEEVRKLAYKDADVVILAFSVEGYLSNVEGTFVKELKRFFPEGQVPPIVLVGTKIDLRERGPTNTSGRPLATYKDGVMLARKIGARRYIECSAKKDPQSCHNVFEAAVRVALQERSAKSLSAVPSFSCFRKVSSQQDDQR